MTLNFGFCFNRLCSYNRWRKFSAPYMLHVSSLYGFLSDVIRNCDLDFDLLTSKTSTEFHSRIGTGQTDLRTDVRTVAMRNATATSWREGRIIIKRTLERCELRSSCTVDWHYRFTTLHNAVTLRFISQQFARCRHQHRDRRTTPSVTHSHYQIWMTHVVDTQ